MNENKRSMTIVIAKKSSYDYRKLKEDVYEILERLDGGVIYRGVQVLIKPNLLASAKPEKAVTTHPLLVKAVTEYVLEKGGCPTVSDSPPLGRFRKIVKETGLEEALKGMAVTVKEFEFPVAISSNYGFSNIELSKEAVEAEVIINLPKLKTHSQMGLTLAVKNLFGTIVGTEKAAWHYKIGENKGSFAELLVAIYKKLSPPINIIDGILAMEGNGPGSGGTPKYMGALIGSDNAVSLDRYVCETIGIAPFSLATNKAAQKLGLTEEYQVIGEVGKVRDFKMPRTSSLLFGPEFARKFLRHTLTSRPSSEKDLCRLCNECIKICPAGAIEMKKRTLDFDYDQCIRCYCCLEVCPHSAINIYTPLPGKILKKVFPQQ